MPTVLLCVAVSAIMACAAVIQVQLTVHFWDTFSAPIAEIKALVIGVAVCMALLEFLLLGLSAEARKAGHAKLAGRVMFVFWFTFLGNFCADYSAFVSLTAGDRDVRAQAAQIYQMDKDRLATLDREIATLQAQLAASEMNIPSAAIQQAIAAQEEINGRYEANQAEVPAGYVRRVARLKSALITAQRLETLQGERVQAEQALRGRSAVPQAIHPQFEAISQLFGGMISPEQVRATLPVILVIAFKSAVIWLFGVLVAILSAIWGQRTNYEHDNADGGGALANDLDDGMAARNEAAGNRAAPPPPDELPPRRRAEPFGPDGEDDIIDQMNQVYDR